MVADRNSGHMHDDTQLDDLLVFDLPTFDDLESFCDRLRPRWPGWSRADDGGWLFAVDLSAHPHDLAVVLNEARELVGELRLPVIRFSLDGRVYALEAAPVVAGPYAAVWDA